MMLILQFILIAIILAHAGYGIKHMQKEWLLDWLDYLFIGFYACEALFALVWLGLIAIRMH
jgi:hypothetical protein